MRKYYPYPLRLHLGSCYSITKKQSFTFSAAAATTLEQETQSLSTSKCRKIRHEFADLLQFPGNPVLYYKKIHSQIVCRGFQNDVFLANILLNTYSKSGSLRNARELFDRMPEKNLISWSSIVSMYSQHGYNEEALLLFLEFRRVFDERPNEFILASVMRACARWANADQGTQVHCFVYKIGFDQDVYVGTTLVDFYTKAGNMEGARLAFDTLPQKSSVTWTTIIIGYVKSGRSEVSLKLFSNMRESDVTPDKYVLSSVLSACSMLEFLEGGKQIHAYVLKREKEIDISIVNVLIDFYAKCGTVQTGRKLFDLMALRDVISWTTMISGYMQNSFDYEAMKLFVEMTTLNWKPDGFACTSFLTSCGSLEALEQGKQVHSYAIKANLENDEFVKNGLIDMYAKCNSLIDARHAFEATIDCSVVSYNAMIEGYSRQDKLSEALDLFHEMRHRLLSPSLLTFVSLLGVSASLSNLQLSQQIHCVILKSGISLEKFAGSSLIDVYSKCALVKDARIIFEELKEKDTVVWNAMLFGYTQQLENEEALKLYSKLCYSSEKPNEFTFVALVTAASNLASLPHGLQFHCHLVKTGQDLEPFVANALVDMYAKCGSIEDAHKVFSYTSWRDVVCWNSMISTFAQNGKSEEALCMFESMINEGINPNYVTFVGVLSACSHAGLVEDGFRFFNSMQSFKVEQGTDHYVCMVSLLGRAGKLYEAKELIDKMPIKPAGIIWRSFLSACRVAGNTELGQYAAEMAISIEPEDSSSYILLSNIFASKGRWIDVRKVRKKMEHNGVVKEPGRSWIELNKEVHVFIARDEDHRDADVIFSVLDSLIQHIKVAGYVPDTTTIMMNDCSLPQLKKTKEKKPTFPNALLLDQNMNRVKPPYLVMQLS